MKRSYFIFPLMAMTALSLMLAGCDDTEDAAQQQGQTTQAPAPNPNIVEKTIYATDAKAYATAEGARTGAVFVMLQNPQSAIDKLLGASTDKAGTVEIHQSYIDPANGTMQMRKVDSIEILPGQQFELKPTGFHIMLLDLPAPLVAGESFDITLKFQNAGDMKVPVSVVTPVAAPAAAPSTAPATTTPPAADEHVHEGADHVHDDGNALAPSTTTDVPVTEAPATNDPMPEATTPAETPSTDEQPAE